MRHLLASSLVVVLAVLAVLGSAGAALARHGDEVLEAVGLTLGLDVVEQAVSSPGPRAPGSVESTTFELSNDGDVLAALLVSTPVARGVEDGCSSSAEARVDADCDEAGEGDLPRMYAVTVTVAPGGCDDGAVTTTVLADTLDRLPTDVTDTGVELAPGATACVRTTGTFRSTDDANAAQGDDVELVVRATLEQR